jgi:hypothetical protein
MVFYSGKGLCISEKKADTEGEQYHDRKHDGRVELFRDRVACIDPLRDFHGRKNHEKEHHDTENQRQDYIQRFFLADRVRISVMSEKYRVLRLKDRLEPISKMGSGLIHINVSFGHCVSIMV